MRTEKIHKESIDGPLPLVYVVSPETRHVVAAVKEKAKWKQYRSQNTQTKKG